MSQITLTKYYNDQAKIMLDAADIETTQRFDESHDAAWGPEHGEAKPYTLVTLRDGAVTSEGVGNAYVAETPEQIEAMSVEPGLV